MDLSGGLFTDRYHSWGKVGPERSPKRLQEQERAFLLASLRGTAISSPPPLRIIWPIRIFDDNQTGEPDPKPYNPKEYVTCSVPREQEPYQPEQTHEFR